jgi:hypothetical protein
MILMPELSEGAPQGDLLLDQARSNSLGSGSRTLPGTGHRTNGCSSTASKADPDESSGQRSRFIRRNPAGRTDERISRSVVDSSDSHRKNRRRRESVFDRPGSRDGGQLQEGLRHAEVLRRPQREEDQVGQEVVEDVLHDPEGHGALLLQGREVCQGSRVV